MNITWGTTDLKLQDALAPDAPLTWTKIGAGSIRRNFSGEARVSDRWSKYAITITWSGITSTSAQQLNDIETAGTTLAFTDLMPSIAPSIGGTRYMRYVPKSISDAGGGYDAQTMSISFEEV